MLPVRTRFSTEKTVEHVERRLEGVGPLAGASGTVSGYEIHMGQSEPTAAVARPVDGAGAASGDVLGTYLHDLFTNRVATDAFVRNTFEAAGIERPAGVVEDRPDPYDRAAALVGDHVDPGPLPVDW